MPHNFLKKFHIRAFTLIETVVATGILLIFFLAISLLMKQVITDIGQSRVRSVALTLAQSKLEIIRNLPYTSVGTVGGIPQGSILQTETVPINGMPFTVRTSIEYVDDAYDGIIPTDLINTDYKRVRVQVSWEGLFSSGTMPVSLVTNIVPRGIETIVGGGTLMIEVINASGSAVPNATVQIDNTSVTPEIHLSTLTNTNGLVVLPGAPICSTCYKINVTKNGYSTDRTYDVTEVANPLSPHATVLEGQITSRSFSIDQVSTIMLYSYGSRDLGYPAIANVIFTLRGTKLIGYTATDDPVYKYDKVLNTGGGIVSLSGLETDSYSLDLSLSNYMLAGSSPPFPLVVAPATTQTAKIVCIPRTNVSYLVTVQSASGTLLASASATLQATPSGGLYVNTTGATGAADFGQAFFGALIPSSYNVSIDLPGYNQATSSVLLTKNQSELFILNPIP